MGCGTKGEQAALFKHSYRSEQEACTALRGFKLRCGYVCGVCGLLKQATRGLQGSKQSVEAWRTFHHFAIQPPLPHEGSRRMASIGRSEPPETHRPILSLCWRLH